MNSHLNISISMNAGRVIWQLGTVNAMGQELRSTADGRLRTQALNEFGQPTRMTVQGLMDYTYDYDPLTGNMIFRHNPLIGQYERFEYDRLNRLTSGVRFSASGNIEWKEGVGEFIHNAFRPHAVDTILGFLDPRFDHDITYTSFQKVQAITAHNSPALLNANFVYGPNRQRRQMNVLFGDNVLSKHYTQNFEVSYINGTRAETKEYIFSPFGLVAIRNNGEINAVATDHLGSIVARFNPRRGVYEYFGFTPWGRRYRYENGTKHFFDETFCVKNILHSPFSILNYFARGFTGHEHMDAFGLINMNGRMYDPIIGRFLSPDPFVPDATFSQDFNRYMYARNNPLSYIDPCGEFVRLAALLFVFTGDLIANLATGQSNPVGLAWSNANNAINGMSNAMQFQIFSNDNTSITVGLDPFSLGISANVLHSTSGGTTMGVGGGFGLFGGWNVGGGISQQVGNWNIGGGVGGGNNHWGWNTNVIHNSGVGLGFGQTHYGGAIGPDGLSNRQITGTPSIFFPGGSVRIENDFFGDGLDRWRTSAIEVSVGNFVVGKRVHTNAPNQNTDDFNHLHKSPIFRRAGIGTYRDSRVFSSPLFIGVRHGNTVSRAGVSHWAVQDFFQNGWHLVIGSPLLYTQHGRPPSFYGSNRFFNPFSLFGR